MASCEISNRTRVSELIAVVLTTAGKFIFMDWLNWRFLFISVAILAWAAYIYYRTRTSPGVLKHWGFRKDNFVRVAKMIIPFGVACLILCICIGLYQDTINISWHILPILMLYPVWGIVQQFLLIALTVGNLQALASNNLPKGIVILISAILFGLIHYPYGWLMLGTFLLALFYGFIYLKQRNIYVLGIFHGWLAAIVFYTIVDRDPFEETFGRLLNF